jgi:hypothetical protein
MSVRLHLMAAVACTLLLSWFFAPSGGLAANIADPIAGLTGRWSGRGLVVPARGAQEDLKCIVTYMGNGNGTQVKQNLRCQGANYKLDTAIHLLINGNRVTGRWADRVHSLGGTVSGTVTPDGLNVRLNGPFFAAQMTIASSQCKQSVTVTPARADYIRQLSTVLKKC